MRKERSMNKVVVQCEEVVKIFENVTKVQYFGGLDLLDGHLDIWQGEKKTVIKQLDMLGFEVK